ncbi:hypothetical protein [Rhizobium mulingense]|uniref:hypothetical protein n=1 Tax=Rhizobium mulingense TaxID=3031128 RepID=UPI002B48AB06|nr:hypothetical protein [Rhizobium sp. MJ21]MEB3047365.1 hypothetical protein [Rhizobium sp. MJ21]
MTEDHKRKLELLWILLVVAALVLPAAFGEPRAPTGKGGDVVRNFLFDFQTLITGILAILAARWTVRQMRDSDRLQQARHERELHVTQMPRKLAALRLAHSVPRQLREGVAQIEQLLDLVPEGAFEPDWTPDAQLKAKFAIYRAHALHRLVNSRAVTDARDFFDPIVEESLEQASDWLKLITDVVSEGFFMEEITPGRRPRWFPEGLGAVLADLTPLCDSLADELDRWAYSFMGARKQTGEHNAPIS